MRRRGFVIALVSALLVTGCGAERNTTVETTAGVVQGILQDGFELFRGIPYAKAPIGENRWRAPQPHPGWQETLAATEFGAQCWQPANSGNDDFLVRLAEGSGMGGLQRWLLTTLGGMVSANTSEDCLFLNVATPNRNASLPVMFWIHGGGHQFGAGGGPYESLSLAAESVVLVSLNYRLGLYGFLAHPDLAAEDPNGSTGNYGTLDQIAALRWVRDNIAAFGGDPNRVTIFGESAGGHSVGQLMASPVARGLFHRAIAQSGTGFYQLQAVDADHERMSGFDAGRALARRAGVAGADEISALRSLSTEELAPLAVDPELSATFHPQIDGYVLPEATAAVFTRGGQAPVPLIVGSNADEGTLLYHFGLPAIDGGPPTQPQTVTEWDALLAAEFGAAAAAALDGEYVVGADANVNAAAEQLMGDTWFGRHAFYMAQAHARLDQPTFLYFYKRHPPAADQTLGASHALELAHVFRGLLPFWPWDARDDELQREMQGHWARFAATGNPNRDGLPAWPGFTALAPRELNYGHAATGGGPVARLNRYLAMRAQFDRRLAVAAGSSSQR